MEEEKPAFIYGINPVQEALKASRRRCFKIVIPKGKVNARIRSILTFSRSRGVKVEILPRGVFQKLYQPYVHQGIIGYFAPREPMDLEELVRQAFQASRTPTLVALDGIQDPGNLGAIIRSAEVLGIQGVILPRNRSASLNETVAKCSSGAIENLSFTWAANLARALDRLKEAGFWVVGVEPGGQTPCYRFEFNLPVVLVVGGEEKGIRPLLREKCDFSVSIPIQGALDSLNASAACAVVFYEVLRQKTTGVGAGCGNAGEPVIAEKKRPEIS